MVRFTLYLVFFLYLAATAWTAEPVSGPHIADVNILLPPKMTRPVEYRLQGTDGCFKWSWDHHDILSVIPEYNGTDHCSTSARLRSNAPYSGRKETAVYAADVYSGIVIRCKVFIDILSRIQIFHNSIKLDLDGLATLRVRGFDSEDNVFSSLVGLQFMWHLIPKNDESRHHLAHVPLRHSPLSDLSGGDINIQVMIEDQGMFSDLYVVKGIDIGLETVNVHLFEPQYEHMEDEIVLTVAEAMSLEPPSPLVVVVGSLVHYTLKVVHGNIPQVVTLPSPFHRWYALNTSVVEVNAVLGSVHALSLGETSIILKDTRVTDHLQISTFKVVLPHSLCLYMQPLSQFSDSDDPIADTNGLPSTGRWYVVTSRQYLIRMKAFSKGPLAHEIYITENEEVKLHYDQSEFWESFPVPESISARYGWQNSRTLHAISQGLGQLSASLTCSVGYPERKQILTVVQEVMVCDEVKIIRDKQVTDSSIILLPWAPGIYQEVKLKTDGGCGNKPDDYKWFSSDMAIVSVSGSGICQAKKLGKATIRVASVFDALNFDEVVIEVLSPSSMVMLPYFPVEAVIGSYLHAAVTMRSSTGDYFYRCDAFKASIRWNTESESFVIVNATTAGSVINSLESVEPTASLYGSPCSSTYIYAVKQCRTLLNATWSKEHLYFDYPSEGQIILKASMPIASYSPLTLHQICDGSQFGGYGKAEEHDSLDKLGSLYLTPGTYLDVELLGGPERWGKGVDFVESVDIIDEKPTASKVGAVVHKIVTSYGHQYRIICNALGTFTVVCRCGNLEGDEHLVSVIEEAHLQLECSYPESIVVLANESVNLIDSIQAAVQADRGPGYLCNVPTTVANGRSIRVAAVGISHSGQAFANSSSVPLSWELDNCNELASWDDVLNLHIAKSSWERFLILHNSSGLCTVRAMVLDLPDDVHSFARLHEGLINVRTGGLCLKVVSELRILPDFILLLYNPDAKMNLSISGGSSFLDAVVNDSKVVELIAPVPGFHGLQLMLMPKGLGTALVTVYDIGLTPPLTASSEVQVADIDWVKITSGEELSIMEGNFQTIQLLAGISNGNSFHPSQYRYMSILVHVEDNVIDLIDSDNISSTADGYIKASNFTIYGRHIGATTLFVSVRQQSGNQILSQQVKVEVYTPPVVHPQDIFLVPGASYVLTLKGGPSLGVIVEYASMDDGAVTVQKYSGQASAISPGNTTVVATLYGKQQQIICQALGIVRVGVPHFILLNAQSWKLATGRELPIFPFLPEGDLFSFYGQCKNYQWSIDDDKILGFREAEFAESCHNELLPSSNYQSSACTVQKDFDGIKLLYGRSAGRAEVNLSLSCDFVSASFSLSRSYNASMSIWVVPEPPLALGIPITWILPPRYTTLDLLPSSEAYTVLSSQTQKSVITYSLLRHYGTTNQEVIREPLSIEGRKIKTTESNNLACIQTTDHTTSRVEVASCVRVAEVAQVRIFKKLAFQAIDLAVGAEVTLPVQYYDELGNPFYEARDVALVDCDTNFRDIVSVNFSHFGDGIIKVKAVHEGRALVRVRFTENPLKSDYVMIYVGAQIYPQNPALQPGASLKFSISGSDATEYTGKWLSANESVIFVDSSGKAVAIGEGTSRVVFQSSNFTVQTVATVLKGNLIFVEAPIEILTNIAFPLKGYRFRVEFSSPKVQPSGVNLEETHDCWVDPPFIGYTKPWRDLNTGVAYCLFFPYSPEHLAYTMPKLMGKRQDISITIHAFLKDMPDVTGSASALFIGGFSILEMDKDLLQVNLSRDLNRSIITIVGNTDVDVHWHNQDQLIMRLISKEGYGIDGFAQYEVKVLGGKLLKDKITFELPSIGQRHEVDVNYDPGESAVMGSTLDLTLWAGVIVCLGLLILSVVIFICYLDKPDRPQRLVHFATHNRTVPVTPAHSSPSSSVNEASPRTPPQPFMDYVKRTIDETPNYRREGRRRFAPQNTY